MQIKTADEPTQTVAQVETKESPVLTGEFEINSVGQLFDLKPNEIGFFKDKINTLLEYAKTQTDDKSIEGLKWAIRSLQSKIGTPPLGEKMINYLNKYAYLKLESLKLNKEIEKYERNY